VYSVNIPYIGFFSQCHQKTHKGSNSKASSLVTLLVVLLVTLRGDFEMRVKIGGEAREVSACEFIESCERKSVEIKRDWYRPFCEHPQAQAILDASPELEAAILLEMAKNDSEIRDALMERKAILLAENLPCRTMDAARALTARLSVAGGR
jgi:hypothetical protein